MHFPMSHSSYLKTFFRRSFLSKIYYISQFQDSSAFPENRKWLFLLWGFFIADTSDFLQHPDILLFGCTTFHVPGHKLALFPLYIPIFSPGTWNMEQKVEIIFDKNKLWEVALMRSSHLNMLFYTHCAKRRNDKNIIISIHFSHNLACPPRRELSTGSRYVDITRIRCYD